MWATWPFTLCALIKVASAVPLVHSSRGRIYSWHRDWRFPTLRPTRRQAGCSIRRSPSLRGTSARPPRTGARLGRKRRQEGSRCLRPAGTAMSGSGVRPLSRRYAYGCISAGGSSAASCNCGESVFTRLAYGDAGRRTRDDSGYSSSSGGRAFRPVRADISLRSPVSAYSSEWPWQDFREVGVCHRAPVTLRHGKRRRSRAMRMRR